MVIVVAAIALAIALVVLSYWALRDGQQLSRRSVVILSMVSFAVMIAAVEFSLRGRASPFVVIPCVTVGITLTLVVNEHCRRARHAADKWTKAITMLQIVLIVSIALMVWLLGLRATQPQ